MTSAPSLELFNYRAEEHIDCNQISSGVCLNSFNVESVFHRDVDSGMLPILLGYWICDRQSEVNRVWFVNRPQTENKDGRRVSTSSHCPDI